MVLVLVDFSLGTGSAIGGTDASLEVDGSGAGTLACTGPPGGITERGTVIAGGVGAGIASS